MTKLSFGFFMMWHGYYTSVLRCYESIRKHEGNIPIVILQNGPCNISMDNYTFSDDSNLTTIESKENIGPAAGRNLLVKNRLENIYIFLDDDTYLTNQISPIVSKYFDDPDVGIVGQNGIFFDPSFNPYTNNVIGEEVDSVSSYCLSIKSSIFHKILGFDERFRLYGEEDFDLCLRTKLIANKKIIADKTLTIVHKEHETRDRLNKKLLTKMQSQNLQLLKEKYHRHSDILEINKKGINKLTCDNCNDIWIRK